MVEPGWSLGGVEVKGRKVGVEWHVGAGSTSRVAKTETLVNPT
jgi:hypothetical protein